MALSGGENDGLQLERCVECSEEVKATEKAVDCDICKKKVHIKCGKVTSTMHGELKKSASGVICQGIKFLCSKCDKIFVTIKCDIIQMMEKQVKMERKQEEMVKDLEAVKREVIDIRGTLTKTNDGKKSEDSTRIKVVEEIVEMKEQIGVLKKQYSDVVRVEGAEANVVTSPRVSDMKMVSELLERNKRQNNLVIFGIDETSDENITKNKINEIITAIGVDASKVKYFGRVGRRVVGNKARVVRVVCEDLETKRGLLKGANKLKTIAGYERTYVSPDLTKSQQEEDKMLREKLKEIRGQYKEAKINNGEIVIMEGGNRKVLCPRLQN